MSDQPESTDPGFSPAERLAAARDALTNAQRFMPPGMPPILEPPHIELMATVNAIGALLGEKGIIGEQEMIATKTAAWADLVEQLVDVVNEVKSQAIKASIVHGSGPGRPL